MAKKERKKLTGGYDVALVGRPLGTVEALGEPDRLILPLRSRRFSFSRVEVEDAQRVHVGQVLAKDPDNYGVPLLAPRGGTVRLSDDQDQIVLEDIVREVEQPYSEQDDPHAPRRSGSAGIQRYKLLVLGAWQFLSEAPTGDLPDPFGTPQAVIVSTLNLEPFSLRGDVQLEARFSAFTRGLEHLQSLLEYQPIYLVLPDISSELALRVRETIRGYAWVKLVQIPLRYPYDHFRILARHLGLSRNEGPIWGLRTEGILAIDRALTLSKPCIVRILSLGGPAVNEPAHLMVIPGYPIEQVLEGRVAEESRVVSDGALTGREITDTRVGLDAECTALTVLPHETERELLSFAQPGWDRGSYSRCFLSSLRRSRLEPLTTLLHGEVRPCLSCGFCEEVCPVGIMPHLIHKYLYQDQLEAADDARADLCVACGLCSYVCPSKIDLRQELIDAQEKIRVELHAVENAVEDSE